MRILPIANYQVQNQNRNQARTSDLNFKGLVKIAEHLHLYPRNLKGVMKTGAGDVAIFFEHANSGRTYRAVLKDPAYSGLVAEEMAKAEAPGINADVTSYVKEVTRTTPEDEFIFVQDS